MNSPSIEDQAALIGDRTECIRELYKQLTTSQSTISSFFFTGDKPAAQFERGTQISGNYPCGAHVVHFDDCVLCKP